ncbi:MAG TPA: polysaccharide biosynthesis/export family protein [Bryobacteraceae bacterium]|nr:polysaccharide biosynthesis/export family protein [Bryobacteraceae bacterium]
MKFSTPIRAFRSARALVTSLAAAALPIVFVSGMAAQQPLASTLPQTPPQGQPQAAPGAPPASDQPQGPAPMGTDAFRPSYELGVSDQILIHAPDADEINEKPFRIDEDGTITLPLIGVVKAAGVTVQQLEDSVKEKLKTYIKNPAISITVVQFRSSPVFFVGDFMRPGIYALQGRHTLVEMLMSVGGLQATAARRIKVTRREDAGPIPLQSATWDPETKSSSIEISLAALSQNINPAEDIVLEPNDTISAEKVEQVYVQGAVEKNGGFDIGDKDYLSTLQLISLAGGLTQDAEPEKARILRPILNSTRRAEIPLDLKRVLDTEGSDYPLLPNDVLYVPRRKVTSQTLTRLGMVATSIIPSLIIYSLLR